MVQTGLDHTEQLTDTHIAAPQPFLGKDDGGKARDQRPVEIEERADLRPGALAMISATEPGNRRSLAGLPVSRCSPRSGEVFMSPTPSETPYRPWR
ncbi:putative transferase domain protein [Mycobacterium kansasii]|uniref:Putative transferase domain protein n=1 Tax=Mycobacterium kansasii TaxID=1768 RepID=A0A1V3XQX8_MYCKA|nr:putative transferase domain protein [Mycobacterium kansasii]